MGMALAKLEEEIQRLLLEQMRLGQTIISGMGELHQISR
jgi:translation elongation factor EF-G